MKSYLHKQWDIAKTLRVTASVKTFKIFFDFSLPYLGKLCGVLKDGPDKILLMHSIEALTDNHRKIKLTKEGIVSDITPCISF